MRKSIFILLFALLGILSARAYDFEVDGIYYNITNGSSKEVEVTAKSSHIDDKYSGAVVIPASVTYNKTTYKVTSIGEKSFNWCTDLTSVKIPNSITTIGLSAFSFCVNLTSVSIPNSVTAIGSSAFLGCSGLTSVTLPNSVASIGSSAFLGCSGLTQVTLPENMTEIETSVFFDCSGLTSVTLPESVTSIGELAFASCTGLRSVTSLSEMPPSCGESTFGYDNYYTIPLYVPAGSKLSYAVAQGWRKFAEIKELAAKTYTVTVKVNDATMGTVTGGGKYVSGTLVTLVAVFNTGYHFVKWDDGVTNLLRTLIVTKDTTLTAIFAKNANPTPNEKPETDNFRVYAQDRTIYLSEDRGLVQVYNMAGQCVYNGHATEIPVSQPGVYIVAVGSQRFKVLVR